MINLKFLQPEVSDASEVVHLKLWEGTAFDYSFNGFGATLTNAPTPQYPGFKFVSASSQNLSIGQGPTDYKTVSFWVKPDSATAANDGFVRLGAGDWIFGNSGTLAVNGLVGHTKYLDSVAGATALTANWQHVVITDSSVNDADDFTIGKIGANFFNGLIDDFRLYDIVRTAAQIRDLYEQTRWRYGV